MMTALIFLIGWCVLSMVFAEVVPLLFEALGYPRGQPRGGGMQRPVEGKAALFLGGLSGFD